MNSRIRHLIVPLAILAMIAVVPAARAGGTDVLRACLNEQSLDGFSDAEKRAALDQLAADQDEYSDCRSVIGGSIGTKKVAASASSSGPSGAAAQTQDPRKVRKAAAREKAEARQARRKRARKERERALGRRAVDPRDATVFKAAGTANGMPLPALLAVIVLGLLALTGALLALSRRNPRVAAALRRVSLPGLRR